MGSTVSTDQLVCHDTLDLCRSHCDKSECVYVDKCNGVAKMYMCMPFDPRFIMWLMVISFLIVLLVCSSLVACYICRAVRRSYQIQKDMANSREVVFNRPGRVYHIQDGYPPRAYQTHPQHRW